MSKPIKTLLGLWIKSMLGLWIKSYTRSMPHGYKLKIHNNISNIIKNHYFSSSSTRSVGEQSVMHGRVYHCVWSDMTEPFRAALRRTYRHSHLWRLMEDCAFACVLFGPSRNLPVFMRLIPCVHLLEYHFSSVIQCCCFCKKTTRFKCDKKSAFCSIRRQMDTWLLATSPLTSWRSLAAESGNQSAAKCLPIAGSLTPPFKVLRHYFRLRGDPHMHHDAHFQVRCTSLVESERVTRIRKPTQSVDFIWT